MIVLAVWLALVVGAVAQGGNVYVDVPFPQLQADIWQASQLPEVAAWHQLPEDLEQIQQVKAAYSSSWSSYYFLLASESLYLFSPSLSAPESSSFVRVDDKFNITITTPMIMLTDAPNPSTQDYFLVIASEDGAYVCDQSLDSASPCTFQSFAGTNIGQVNDLAALPGNIVAIGAEGGLFLFNLVTLEIDAEDIPTGPVNAVAFVAPTDLVAGTDTMLWRNVGGSRWVFFRVPGIIDGPIVSLSVDAQGSLWIGNDVCVNIQHSNLTFERIGYLEGLTYTNVSKVQAFCGSGSVWTGSSVLGASRLASPSQRGQFKFFFGPRWLPSREAALDTPGNSVVDIACAINLPSSNVTDLAIVVTQSGFSVVSYQLLTLEQKAQYFQSLVYPAHDRFGLTANTPLAIWGNVSSYVKSPSANDGLWTSMYTSSQAFRYAVTKDPQAKLDAWNGFLGLELLNNVTGIEGLMARSVAFTNDTSQIGDGWYNSTAIPGFSWWGDTSSDEISGHMYVYPLLFDLVAETPEEKARVYRLINNIMSYIVENNFMLIDVTGKPTTWGRWNPQYLEDTSSWYDEQGINSLQILSWLLSAYRITNDDFFLNAYQNLTQNYFYDINVVNAKITQTTDDNFSDDELMYLNYHSYIWNNITTLSPYFDNSMMRSFSVIKPERAVLYNFIHGAWLSNLGQASTGDFDLSGSIQTLQEWPLSWIDWPVANSYRHDVTLNLDPGRQGDSVNQLPYDEICYQRWNGDPYTLDNGSGRDLTDPTAWLLPYWIGRYYGFITPATSA